jgi:hypothetical protein
MPGTTALATTTIEVGLNRNLAPDHDACLSIPTLLCNVASQRYNLTRELVTGHKRITRQRRIAINKMKISPTDTTRLYSYEQLIRAWQRIRDTAHPNVARSVNDCSLHKYLEILSLRGYNPVTHFKWSIFNQYLIQHGCQNTVPFSAI